MDDDLSFVLDDVRSGRGECEDIDDFKVFKNMLGCNPNATDEQIAKWYAAYSAECYTILFGAQWHVSPVS